MGLVDPAPLKALVEAQERSAGLTNRATPDQVRRPECHYTRLLCLLVTMPHKTAILARKALKYFTRVHISCKFTHWKLFLE